jgi:hypothetical protein
MQTAKHSFDVYASTSYEFDSIIIQRFDRSGLEWKWRRGDRGAGIFRDNVSCFPSSRILRLYQTIS